MTGVLRCTLLLSTCFLTLAAETPDAVVLLRTAQSAPGALERVRQELGSNAFECTLAHDGLPPERLKRARVLFLEHPSPELLVRWKPAALEAIRGGLKVASDIPDVVQRAWGVEVNLPLTRRLLPYFQNGGEDNLRAFFLSIYQEAGGKPAAIPPPVELPRTGVYHPDAPRLFPSLSEYLEWYRKAKPHQGALAAVSFFHAYVKNGDLAFIDAQLRALERQGLAAAGLVGWPLHTLDKVFEAPPSDPLQVLLAFTLSLPKPEDADFLKKLNIHVISLMVTRDSYAQWAATDRGVTTDRVATSLANPETAGATDPIMVATTEAGTDGMDRTMPIAERVEMAARRARRWIALRRKPNSEKHLAILYYNNPPGKGNLGASYLNLPPSIEAVLQRLQREGYLVGGRIPTAGEIIGLLEKAGRNVETWAPGELTKMLETGGVTLLPVEKYRQWFDELPEEFRKSINARWGPPEQAELMTWRSDSGRRFFVIPGLRLGNVFLGPQLLRASFAEYTNVQHSGTLPPHHGYVAAYLYYRHQLNADAVIHMGRHGTLEWLPGKNAGQAGWDCSEVILGDLPNLNYYIMDGSGEAIQARRRSAAVDLSHLTPMLARAGKEDRFASLDKALTSWEETHESSPALAAEYAANLNRELESSGLAKQLKLDLSHAATSYERVREFLDSVEDAPMPLGLPILGQMPSDDRQIAGLGAFLQSSFELADARRLAGSFPTWAADIAAGRPPAIPEGLPEALRAKVSRALDDGHTWLSNVRLSPERELAVLTGALRAEFVPSGLVGDPLAVPAALPTGRNLHQGDPAMIPTKAAWEVGKKLAGQLLADHKKKNGRYPERISMVLWQGETGRHQGAMEAQAMYLMGVEPEWNARGVPDRLKIIPDAQLGRLRVNVVFTVSGLYRDGYPDKILMLDRAARLAASAGDNALSRQNRETEAALKSAGVDPQQAAAVAGARVFTTAPGSYGFGLQQMVEQSRDKEEPKTMAQLYLSKMNYVYTEKAWGTQVPKLLESQLKGNQVILHSRSSNLYGAVDNDDVYQWMGGLRIASEAAGAKPELLMNNFRRPGREKLETAAGFIASELNARNWNPEWIREMKKEGYSGAREMGKAIEFLYGWQATAPETIAPEVWKKTYDVYVADEYNLGMKEFFDKANPAMRQNVVARLLEVDRQGTYRFTTAERRQLVKEFVRLVSQVGVACSANVCGNRKLQAAALSEARRMPPSELAPQQLAEFRKQFQQALRPTPAAPSAPKPALTSKHTARPDLWRGLRVKIIDMKEFAARARRVVTDNPLILLYTSLGLLGSGLLLALYRRRPNQWAELKLGNPPVGGPS